MSERETEYQLTVMPQMSLSEAVARHNATVDFVKKILHQNVDFGVIPGTDKPTLLKPGAEKLATFFGLHPRFNLLDQLQDWDKGRFNFRYSCELWRNGEFIASGEGSCNSMEKKYRFRNISEAKATEDEKARAIKRETKDGKYGRWVALTVENDDPFTLVNTLQKMAQKRALIAAVLVAVNASEFFTQDIEDMTIEGEFTEITEDKPAPPVKPTSSPPKSKPTRPADPETVRGWLADKAAKYINKPATQPMVGLLAGKISEALQDSGEKPRHLINLWLWGTERTGELPPGATQAMLDWLVMEKDDSGDYPLNAYATQELLSIKRQAEKDAGQQELVAQDTEDLYGEAAA